jgi:hypothetical protein
MSQFFQPNNEALEADFAKQKREAVQEGEIRPFQLQKGVTELRILPPFNERGVWYRELKEYFFSVNGEWTRITSPSQFGLPDPVAEKRQELNDIGGQANMDMAKTMLEKRIYLYNVIVKSAPQGVEFVPGQVYVLKTGVKVKRALLNFDRDPGGGWSDITNEDHGVTFRITRSGSGLNTDYQVAPCANRTRLEDDLAAVNMGPITGANLYDLDALFPPLPYEEIKMKLVGIRAAKAETNVPTPTTPQFQPVQAQPTGPTGTPPADTAVPSANATSSTPAPQAIPAAQTVVQGPAPQAVPVAQPQPVVQPQQTAVNPVNSAPAPAALPEIPAPPPAEE